MLASLDARTLAARLAWVSLVSVWRSPVSRLVRAGTDHTILPGLLALDRAESLIRRLGDCWVDFTAGPTTRTTTQDPDALRKPRLASLPGGASPAEEGAPFVCVCVCVCVLVVLCESVP